MYISKEQDNSDTGRTLTMAALTMPRDKTKIHQDLRLDSMLVSDIKQEL